MAKFEKANKAMDRAIRDVMFALGVYDDSENLKNALAELVKYCGMRGAVHSHEDSDCECVYAPSRQTEPVAGAMRLLLKKGVSFKECDE